MEYRQAASRPLSSDRVIGQPVSGGPHFAHTGFSQAVPHTGFSQAVPPSAQNWGPAPNVAIGQPVLVPGQSVHRLQQDQPHYIQQPYRQQADPVGTYGTTSLPAPVVKGTAVTQLGVVMTGIALLMLLMLLPCWDATVMLRNTNYVFWAGRGVPMCILAISCMLIIFLVFFAEIVFGNARMASGWSAVPSVQSLVMLASLVLTICGLLLILMSLPLSKSSVDTYGNIVYHCHSSSQTRHTWMEYQALLTLRNSPACAKQYNIEKCDGFTQSVHSDYLKHMEMNFRCSGFCLEEDLVTASAAADTRKAVKAAKGLSLLQLLQDHADEHDGLPTPSAMAVIRTSDWMDNLNSDGMGAEGLLNVKAEQGKPAPPHAAPPQAAPSPHGNKAEEKAATNGTLLLLQQKPPTLFSNANFKTTCDGAAARDMANFGKDVAMQAWYSGIILISISIIIGLMEWTVAVKHFNGRTA